MRSNCCPPLALPLLALIVSLPRAGCTPPAATYFATAEDLYASGDLKGALQEYDKILRVDSTSARVYNRRGMVLHELGYIEEAIAAQSQAIRINPGLADAYSCRGAAWFDLYNILRQQPDDSLSSEDRVMHSMRISTAQALMIDDFTKATKLNPQDDWACNSLGRAYYEIGNYTEAIQCFTHATLLNPWASWVYYNRGLAEMELNDYGASIDDFTKALDADSEDGWAYFKRGEARLRLGDLVAGCEDLRSALKLGVEEAGWLIDSNCH